MANKLPPPNDEKQVVAALNKHGMFFQQAILKRFLGFKHGQSGKNPFKVKSVIEEHPTYFNGHGAVDIVARAKFDAGVGTGLVDVVLVVECKKAYPPLNRIVLLESGVRNSTRFMWESFVAGDGERASHELGWIPFNNEPETTVCSDGLWLKRGKANDQWSTNSEPWGANKDPLYQAANQVCSHLMGVMRSDVSRNMGEVNFGARDSLTYYLPLIVTNCPIFIADPSGGTMDVETGEVSQVSLKSVESAFYIHPFARIPGDESDIRRDYDDFDGPDLERDKHTVLLLNPSALDGLLGERLGKSDLVNVLYGPLYDRAMSHR